MQITVTVITVTQVYKKGNFKKFISLHCRNADYRNADYGNGNYDNASI
jgi:hypothetical protein